MTTIKTKYKMGDHVKIHFWSEREGIIGGIKTFKIDHSDIRIEYGVRLAGGFFEWREEKDVTLVKDNNND